MKDLLEKWKKFSKEETRRFLIFLSIPLVVIILMIVIVLVDKPNKQGTKGTEEVLASVESSAAVDKSKETEPEKVEITLKKEAVPKIHDLMEAYFKARRTCDTKALSNVYGETSSKEELNAQGVKLEEEVKFYQDYKNLECYTAPGIANGDYLVYAKFDIQFRQAETLAPSLIVCYAKTSADNNYYLVANTNEEQSKYMEEANKSDQVQAMAKEVNHKLEQALQSDDNLMAVYHTLMDQKEEPEGTDESNSSEENTTQETETSSESDRESNNT